MGLTTVRYFRDKLAMRARAQEAGMLVPEFVHVLNHDNLREFMARVPGPWLLKPRSQASGIGMKKIQRPEELWPWLDQLGDQQSFYLLEQFVPGSVYHVDSIASERGVVFAAAHAYGTPRWIPRITAAFSRRVRFRTMRKKPKRSGRSIVICWRASDSCAA